MLERFKDTELDPRQKKCVQDIEEFGCHIIQVSGEDHPNWSYSIGLHERFRHPEVIVCGLKQDVAGYVINEVKSWVANGAVLEIGKEYLGLLEGVNCQFGEVQREWIWHLMGWDVWFYDRRPFSAIQCIYPDHNGKWPWDEGFKREWLDKEPILARNGAASARVLSFLTEEDLREAGHWGFPEATDQKCIVEKPIIDELRPILLVSHDNDGSWDFLLGNSEPGSAHLAHLRHMVMWDPSLETLADLPNEWCAWRDSPSDPWQRSPWPDDWYD